MSGVMWFFQRLSGVLILLGLIVHFYVMHYSGAEAIGYEAVIARLSSPLWKVFDIVFLLLIIGHAINGLWGMVVEYVAGERMQFFLKLTIVMIYAGMAMLGISIII